MSMGGGRRVPGVSGVSVIITCQDDTVTKEANLTSEEYDQLVKVEGYKKANVASQISHVG